VTYQDTVERKRTSTTRVSGGIVIDQTILSFFSDGDVEGPFGWRMHNGAHVAWAFDIPGGAHEIRVENLTDAKRHGVPLRLEHDGQLSGVEEISLKELSPVRRQSRRTGGPASDIVKQCRFDVYAMGFSNRSWDVTLEILNAFAIKRVVDIRTLPGSKHTLNSIWST
jgi:hypothetical protein